MCGSPFFSLGSADSASRSDFLDLIFKEKEVKRTPTPDLSVKSHLPRTFLLCSQKENKNKIENKEVVMKHLATVIKRDRR